MPTASKLISCVFFCALAWFVAALVVGHLPDGTQVGLFGPIMALIGGLCGWKLLGSRAGEGPMPSMGYGLTTSLMIVFWGLLVFSMNEMIYRSLRMHYDGPVDALLAAARIAVDYASTMAQPDVIFALVAGGLFAGWMTEFFSERVT